MAGRSYQRRGTPDHSGGTRAEDAEADARATDEGMPEHPDGVLSKAPAGTDLAPHRGPIAPLHAGPDGRVTVDDYEEEGGGYDLGGEA
jgi:hypothetical protein